MSKVDPDSITVACSNRIEHVLMMKVRGLGLSGEPCSLPRLAAVAGFIASSTSAKLPDFTLSVQRHQRNLSFIFYFSWS